MLTRFCLYGFLKNQRYFEPVLVLALLDRGLTFAMIGVLYGFRELLVALLEIPSGAAADVLGRRGSLLLAVGAYMLSILVFALPGPPWLLFGAMACYAIGDSFRSGTHKAMIFRWLEIEGRTDEKTRVYGLTRSWSKLGSAVAVIAGGAVLAITADYRLVFACTLVPYAALLAMLLTYPRDLESPKRGGRPGGAFGRVALHTRDSLRLLVRRPRLRMLLLSTMGFEGAFHASKDYLQPVLAAIALGSLAAASDERAVALVLTPVYFVLFLLAAWASRSSHRFAAWCGGDEAGARRLWVLYGLCFAAVLVSPWAAPIAGAFVALHVIQNLWRPMLIARFDEHGEESHGATLLSVESQARHLAAMVLAPAVGFAVQAATDDAGETAVWPVGAIGLAVCVVPIVTGVSRRAGRG